MNFLIISNKYKDEEHKFALQISKFLNERGHISKVIEDNLSTILDYPLNKGIINKPNYVIAIGGDGTILRAVKMVNSEAPIIGVNVGRCGYIGDINTNNIMSIINSLINFDKTVISEHKFSLMKGTIVNQNFSDYSFNDIVIGREGFAKTVNLDLYINKRLVKNFMCDGIVVATPCGSTAYNLSLRGPIADPDSKNLIITPIASHSFTFGSLIVSQDSEIEIVVNGRNKETREALITFDGRENDIILKDQDVVKITNSDKKTTLLFTNEYDFYENLAKKLK